MVFFRYTPGTVISLPFFLYLSRGKKTVAPGDLPLAVTQGGNSFEIQLSSIAYVKPAGGGGRGGTPILSWGCYVVTCTFFVFPKHGRAPKGFSPANRVEINHGIC